MSLDSGMSGRAPGEVSGCEVMLCHAAQRSCLSMQGVAFAVFCLLRSGMYLSDPGMKGRYRVNRVAGWVPALLEAGSGSGWDGASETTGAARSDI